MEIQLKVVSCCKFLMYWAGVNHKINSPHVVNFDFTPIQLYIKKLQHDDSRYTCKPIKDFGSER